jgi:NADPH:quinone reductase-like Zn-dependent oxidoreductase
MVSAAMGCIPLPDAINDEQGSMLLVNPLTAVAFFDIIRQNKHKAVINTAAASSLGRFNELLGRKNNIPLIHIVRNENQVRNLKDRGAEFVLNSASNEFETDLHTYVTRLGATLALDAVGGSLTRQLLSALPYGGTVIIYGNLSGEAPETDHRSLVADNKQISGFYLVNWLKEHGMLTMIRSIVHARQLLKNEVSVAVQSRFPLERAQEAVDTYLSNMSAGKVLLVPGFNLR